MFVCMFNLNLVLKGNFYLLSSTYIDKKLTLKGKFTGPNIESLIRKYLRKRNKYIKKKDEYVICGDCKSPNTKLEKEPESKLYKIECN